MLFKDCCPDDLNPAGAGPEASSLPEAFFLSFRSPEGRVVLEMSAEAVLILHDVIDPWARALEADGEEPSGDPW